MYPVIYIKANWDLNSFSPWDGAAMNAACFRRKDNSFWCGPFCRSRRRFRTSAPSEPGTAIPRSWGASTRGCCRCWATRRSSGRICTLWAPRSGWNWPSGGKTVVAGGPVGVDWWTQASTAVVRTAAAAVSATGAAALRNVPTGTWYHRPGWIRGAVTPLGGPKGAAAAVQAACGELPSVPLPPDRVQPIVFRGLINHNWWYSINSWNTRKVAFLSGSK